MLKKIPYDRVEAISYAERWALSRNPAYFNFDKLGGDCTNFISQCIFAGSQVMNYTPLYGWFYKDINNRTPSWTGVPFLYNFLIGNKSAGPYGTEVGINEVIPGDIIQLEKDGGAYDHTLIVTHTGDDIYVCAHSLDALNRPLLTYTYNKARFIHIEGVRK